MTKAEQTRLTVWRFKVLQRAGAASRNVARTCRHFGISRKTFYKWKRRHDEHGAAGLCDRPAHAAPVPASHAAGSRQQDSVSPAALPLSARDDRRLSQALSCRVDRDVLSPPHSWASTG